MGSAEALPLSIDELRVVTGTEFPVQMNEDVVKIILECKKDMWSNTEIFEISNVFFDSCVRTLDLCAALENCLRRARDSQLSINLALKQFAEVENEGDERFVRSTFEELKKVQEAGDPFTPEFVELLQSLYKQHSSTFNKLQIGKRKLDKRSNTMKARNKATNVVFVTAFVSVVTFSIVAAVKSAPPLVIGLAAAQAVPIGPIAKWCNTIWNQKLKKIEKEKQLITSMERLTFTVIKELEDIEKLVRILSIKFGFYADLDIREQGYLRIVIDEIKRRHHDFVETIEKLSVLPGECSKKVTMERAAILQKIIRDPSSTPSES